MQRSIDHPDWRHARRKLEETFEKEMLAERESGKIDSRLTADQIREMARTKATRACELASRHHESPESVLARKRKTSQAA